MIKDFSLMEEKYCLIEFLVEYYRVCTVRLFYFLKQLFYLHEVVGRSGYILIYIQALAAELVKKPNLNV